MPPTDTNIYPGQHNNRVENVENVEWGGVDRPMVGAAVPCRPHGFGRGDRENGESGFRQDLQDGQDWG